MSVTRRTVLSRFSRTSSAVGLCFAMLLLVAALAVPHAAMANGSPPQPDNAPQASSPAVPKPAKAQELFMQGRGYGHGTRALFELRFNAPMNDMSQKFTTPMSPEDMPFTVSPALAGEGRWVNATTFAFTSYDTIPVGRSYTFAPKDTLTAMDGRKFTGTPVTISPRPFTMQTYQTRYAADGTVTLRMQFNASVDPAKLKSALTVADTKSKTAYPFELRHGSGSKVREFFILFKPEKFGKVTLTLPRDFASEEGPDGLHSNQSTLETSSMFGIRRIRGKASSSPPWRRYISVETNNSVDIDTARKYMVLAPDMNYKLEASPEGFRITGDFLSRPRVNVTMKKGMPGLTGVLTQDFTSTVVFQDFPPNLSFDATGNILSPNRSLRLPFSSINVEQVQATLWQLPENNIPLMAMGFFGGYQKHLSRKIAVRTGAVNAVRNHATESSLDLAQIAGKAKGVFLLTLSDASDPKKVRPDEARNRNEDEYDEDDGDGSRMLEKLVVISDIGITARVMPNAVTVWANSISTANAISNARVRVFTANNLLLAEGKTDKDGLWKHTRSKDWDQRERPALVLVSTAPPAEKPKAESGLSTPSYTDMAFVRLEKDLAADSAFDTGGRSYLRAGYEAYCFTPRGIFRPGETVDFKVLVRNAQMAAPERFPVAWTVRSSTGRTVGRGTAMLSAQGGAAFSLPLVPSSPTGRYTMTVALPGQADKPLGFCAFSVEDFQPPRIEVKLATETPFTVGKKDINVSIDSKYLFGAPVAGAPWESSVSVSPRYFSHPDWRAFTFPSSQSRAISTSEYTSSGKLDDKGRATFSISPNKNWEASVLNVTASVRVREDGGRWVARNITVPRFKSDILLGYELPQQEAQAGSPYAIRIAAVTPEGRASSLKEVSAVCESVQTYYVRTDRGYSQSIKYVPVSQQSVALTDGKGTFTVTPPQRGQYRIRVTDAGGNASFTVSMHIWSGMAASDDGASPLVDRVMLSWDKPKYQVGETALLKVRSPFPGRLLLVMESEKELYRQVINLKKTEETVTVPILNGMLPNAYCSAWVIRPVKAGEKWGAHRAFGIAPITIDRTASRLAVSIDAPERTLPKKDMPVTITVKDASGAPVRGEVTLAFVDEGLLSITNHATPDPFGYFAMKRAMLGMSYDLYDDLMPLSSRKAITLRAGGGAAEDGSLISPMTRKLELLSIFLGSVTTDESGKAVTTLNLPEYSGRGRLMAVAATSAAVGSADSRVRVARDITVEATVPRMVAPGDTFTVPLVVFGEEGKNLRGKVAVVTEGPLEVAGKREFPVTLTASASKLEMPLSVKAKSASGMAALKVITTIEGSTEPPFEQRLEIPVRPPYPRLTRTGFGVVKSGETAPIEIGGGFYPGTQNVTLSFSDNPGVGLFSALDYLRGYPYGCLEQTTSGAWPYLAVPLMLKHLDPEKAADTEFKQALDYAIRRILSMQRSDGAFNYWPGSSGRSPAVWNSVYAAHMLTEAKGTGLVPQDALKAALDWMRAYLASPMPSADWAVMDSLSVKAYICYVLALNGDAPLGWIQFLNDQGKFLSQSSRIFIAGALAQATGKTDALKMLGTQPFKRTSRYGWSLESAPRNEALRLLMWANANPFAPETALLAKRVLEDGNKRRWRSTQENAMAVVAIGRFMEKTTGKSRAFNATLSAMVNGAATDVARFTDKSAPTFSRAMLPSTEQDIPAPLSLAVKGDGTAYYSWTTSGVPTEAQKPFAEGLFVGRRWMLSDGTVIDFMDEDGQGNLKTKPGKLTVPQGEKITVTLYIKPDSDLTSLVLADIVPGGFEIDNPALVPDGDNVAAQGRAVNPKTGKPVPAPKAFRNARQLHAGNARTEMRDDRLLLFADHMSSGPSAYTYTLRAVNKGTFVLPPVSAEDMYDPTIRSLTAGGEVIVE